MLERPHCFVFIIRVKRINLFRGFVPACSFPRRPHGANVAMAVPRVQTCSVSNVINISNLRQNPFMLLLRHNCKDVRPGRTWVFQLQKYYWCCTPSAWSSAYGSRREICIWEILAGKGIIHKIYAPYIMLEWIQSRKDENVNWKHFLRDRGKLV